MSDFNIASGAVLVTGAADPRVAARARVRAVVDLLFDLLEARFAGNPMLALLVRTLHAVADALVDQIAAKTA